MPHTWALTTAALKPTISSGIHGRCNHRVQCQPTGQAVNGLAVQHSLGADAGKNAAVAPMSAAEPPFSALLNSGAVTHITRSSNTTAAAGVTTDILQDALTSHGNNGILACSADTITAPTAYSHCVGAINTFPSADVLTLHQFDLDISSEASVIPLVVSNPDEEDNAGSISGLAPLSVDHHPDHQQPAPTCNGASMPNAVKLLPAAGHTHSHMAGVSAVQEFPHAACGGQQSAAVTCVEHPLQPQASAPTPQVGFHTDPLIALRLVDIIGDCSISSSSNSSISATSNNILAQDINSRDHSTSGQVRLYTRSTISVLLWSYLLGCCNYDTSWNFLA
eukprot:jgi/Chrzof1/13330/Cz07g29040.t1